MLTDGSALDLSAFPPARVALFASLARCAEPLEELTVSQWADRYRVVSAESGSPRSGPWSTAFMPHTAEPMDCMHPDHPARRVVLKWAAQTAKTEIGVNVFGYVVDRAPGPILTMLPSLDEAIKYNRVKLQPAIDASPQIRHRIRAENQRDEASSTTSFKRFAGGFNQIVTASSSKGLQMISVRYLIAEEITGYPLDTDGRGPPLKQGMARQKAYDKNLKQLLSGTPGQKAICQISSYFEEGDKRRRYVSCPHCAACQILTPSQMQAPCAATSNQPSFACMACGSLMEEKDKPVMLAGAVWISTLPLPPLEVDGEPRAVPECFPETDLPLYACPPCEGRCRNVEPSYALWTAYSPLESWGSLWAEWQEAKKSPLALKTFSQQYLGEAWEETESEVDHERLHAARVDLSWRIATLDHPLLTGFIDVQGDRLEWGVWGWGPNTNGILVDKGIIPHGPETLEAVAAIDHLVAQPYETSTGGSVEVARWGIDGSAYSNWVRHVGAGRGHKLWVCEGSERKTSPVVGTPKRREVKDKFGRVLARCLVYPTGVFDIKHTIYRGLRQFVAGRMEAGTWPAGTLLLPRDGVDEAYCRQLTAEICVDPREQAKGNARRRLHEKPGDQRIWVKRAGWPNEALDIAVGCRAIAWSLGLDTLQAAGWERWKARLAPPDRQDDLFSPVPAPAPAGNDYFKRLAALNNSG